MRYLLGLILCLLAKGVQAQQYNFINYTVEDGLAQSQVRDICQDQHGYLWIGTASGLSRYNGIEFINYSIDDGLPDNNISSLYLSKKDELWVATAGGVAKFKEQKITTYYFDEIFRINDMAELKGQVYFASNTGLLELNNEVFEQKGDLDQHDYYLRSIVNFKDSVLFCGTKNGIYTWDGKSFQNFEIPGWEELNIRNLKIAENKLFITARRVGLLTYDFNTKEVQEFNLEYTTANAVNVTEGSIFGISTNSGAFLIRDKDTLYFNNTNGLMESRINCVYRDSEGILWLGTDGRGLLKFSGTSIVSYTKDDRLSSNIVLGIDQDNEGNFIFGTYDQGITQFNGESIEYIKKGEEGLMDNTVWTVMHERNTNCTWLGTSRGLTILDENNKPVNNVLDTYSPKIRTMVRVDKETVLLGGDEGLIVLQNGTISQYPELNINKLYVLNNNIYCATSVGLFYYTKGGDYGAPTKVDLPVSKVFAITADNYNNLWIGTENGLFVQTVDQTIVKFQLDKRDYRSKNILGLITAVDGSVWVSGMKGVYQIKEKTTPNGIGFTIYNYGSPEGLVDEEANINAIYEDNEQNIWIGTASALARIDPSSNDELFSYQLPILHITGVRLFMENFDYNDYNVKLDSVFEAPIYIELPHNKNHLTFDFIGINLKDPKSVQYEYRLIGADDQWSPVSRASYATYSFIQPGDYTFQVRAMNKNKEWSTIQQIDVTILPPFWKTWWFITLIAIAVFLLIWFFFQSRISALKQKQDNEQLELKNRLLFLEQRSLNASMNRHFIFNSLNSIQYFINSSDKRSANRFLSSFAKLIRMNLDSSAANNFIVTLQEEVERIELYLSLEKMRFSDKFEFEIDLDSSLDTESIEIPSMILQPFVENSIIHGVLSLEQGGLIVVKIYKELGQVVFEVTDNGIGIDNSLKNKKVIVEGDHESKGVEITNRRIEILRKLTGENLLIVGPFQMNNKDGKTLGTKVILKLGGADSFEE